MSGLCLQSSCSFHLCYAVQLPPGRRTAVLSSDFVKLVRHELTLNSISSSTISSGLRLSCTHHHHLHYVSKSLCLCCAVQLPPGLADAQQGGCDAPDRHDPADQPGCNWADLEAPRQPQRPHPAAGTSQLSMLLRVVLIKIDTHGSTIGRPGSAFGSLSTLTQLQVQLSCPNAGQSAAQRGWC